MKAGENPALPILARRCGRDADLGGTQEAVVEHETFCGNLNDVACFGTGHRGLEHGFVQLWIKPVANFGHDWVDAVLFES